MNSKTYGQKLPFVQFVLIFLILTSIYPNARAQSLPWRIQPGLVDQDQARKLAASIPERLSAAELPDLLKLIAQKFPMQRLRVEHTEDNSWLIVGSIAPKISKVNFSTKTREMASILSNRTAEFLGTVDSPETQGRLLEAVSDQLLSMGYSKARVSIDKTTIDQPTIFKRPALEEVNSVVYTFTIGQGEPCTISDAKTTFPLTNDLTKILSGWRVEGELCDSDQVGEAVERLNEELHELGYFRAQLTFDRFEYAFEDNTAVVWLRGTVGQRTAFRIEDPLGVFVASEVFDPDAQDSIDPAIVSPDSMVRELETKYQSRGYDEVRVSPPQRSEASDGLVTYTFVVQPGKRFVVGNWNFRGIRLIDEQEAKDILGVSSFFTNTVPLNRRSLDQGIEQLKGYYQSLGYWDIAIDEPRVTKDRELGVAEVTLTIREGLRHRLTQVDIKGARHFSDSELREVLPTANEEYLDRSTLGDFNRNLRRLYVEAGFPSVNVEVSLSRQRLFGRYDCRLTLMVTEGQRMRFGNTRIEGLVRTKPKVILRELNYSAGDWYSPEKIKESRSALITLGLFKSVQIQTEQRSALALQKDRLDVVISVSETPPGRISFGPSWSSDSGWQYGMDTSYSNLFGEGRGVSLRLEFSQELRQRVIGNELLLGKTIGLGYREPYVLDMPFTGVLSLTYKARATNFWEISNEFRASLTHKFRGFLDRLSLTGFYSWEVNEEVGSPVDVLNPTTTPELQIGKIGLELDWDLTDASSWPKRGFKLGAETSLGGYIIGSSIRFSYWKLSYSVFRQLLDDLVIMFGSSMEAYLRAERKISGDRAQILPRAERLFVGGGQSIRGFEVRSLGPQLRYQREGGVSGCASDPLGGSKRLILTSELRYRFTNSLASAFFLDLGNVFTDAEESTKLRSVAQGILTDETRCPDDPDAISGDFDFELSKWLSEPQLFWQRSYISYGLSLNFLTPIGSLNLAYGLPWRDPCQDDRNDCQVRYNPESAYLARGQFHINVGAKF